MPRKTRPSPDRPPARRPLGTRTAGLALSVLAAGSAAEAQAEIRSVDAETLARIEARIGPDAAAPAAGPTAYLAGAALLAAFGFTLGGGDGDGDAPDDDGNDDGPDADYRPEPDENPYTDRRPDQGWRDALGPDPRTDAPAESYDTDEFRANYGLEAINVRPRYVDGGTGYGTLVSVLDSGADVTHPELEDAVVDELSYSYFLDADGTDDVRDLPAHGTPVAAIIAGARDGEGMHGVAFDAKLQILQGIERSQDSGIYINWAIADAFSRATEAGAVAINNSWVTVGTTIGDVLDSDETGPFYDPKTVSAMQAAAKSGLVSVFSAGNDARKDVSVDAGLPLAVDGLDGHWLAVVATDDNDTIADFSNRCGRAQDFCLAAPGVGIASAVPGGGQDGEAPQYARVSGTSFAAPHVSGAVAVLKSAFPELTGAQITRILLETARDAGAPGTDPVYGRGILDLTNAVAPQGQIVFKTGADIHDGDVAAASSGMVAAGALGRSLAGALSGQDAMVADRYDRGYRVDLGDFVATSETGLLDDTAHKALRDFTLARATPMVTVETPGARLAISRQAAFRGADTTSAARSATWVDPDALASPYAGLIEASRVSMTRRTGAAAMRMTSAASRADSDAAGTYLAAALDFGDSTTGRLTTEIGFLEEHGAMLGSRGFGAFVGDGMTTRTRFARVSGTLPLDMRTRLHASASTGLSQMSSDGMLARGRDIATTSLAAGVSRTGLLGASDTLTFAAAQRLSVDGGRLDLDVPDAMGVSSRDGRDTSVRRATRQTDLGAAQAPIALQAGYTVPAWGGTARLGARWVPEAAPRPDLAAGLSWRF